MGHMISVANKEAQFVKFETLQGIENNINKFRVNILEFRNFRSIFDILLILWLFCDSDQWLISLELFEELLNRLINHGNNWDYFSHYFILHNDVTLCFYDSNVRIIVLLFIYYRILCVCFCRDLWKSTLYPQILRISHRSDTFDIRLELCSIFSVIFTMLGIKIRKWWFRLI